MWIYLCECRCMYVPLMCTCAYCVYICVPGHTWAYTLCVVLCVSLYVYVCVCKPVHMHVCTSVYMNTHVHVPRERVHGYACAFRCMEHMHVPVCVCVHLCLHMCVCVCAYVSVCTFVCVRAYVLACVEGCGMLTQMCARGGLRWPLASSVALYLVS